MHALPKPLILGGGIGAGAAVRGCGHAWIPKPKCADARVSSPNSRSGTLSPSPWDLRLRKARRRSTDPSIKIWRVAEAAGGSDWGSSAGGDGMELNWGGGRRRGTINPTKSRLFISPLQGKSRSMFSPM